MDNSEDPRVIAALLTYLYTFDYSEDGPQLSFGLPREESANWSLESESTTLPEYTKSTEEAPLIEWEEPISAASSEFDFSPSSHKGEYDGDAKHNNDGWETLSASSTAQKSPDSSPCRCTTDPAPPASFETDKDPGKMTSPLALHVQMYRAGLRFGIPCLMSHALKKFERRMDSNGLEDAELLEAASQAYAEIEGSDWMNSLECIQQRMLTWTKARWQSVRERPEFEELVLRMPAFGRDVLRLL
jgi:hypothetical protein